MSELTIAGAVVSGSSLAAALPVPAVARTGRPVAVRPVAVRPVTLANLLWFAAGYATSLLAFSGVTRAVHLLMELA